jgi:hypothetical protein
MTGSVARYRDRDVRKIGYMGRPTSLMLDDLGDRAGFPPEIIMELDTLEAYMDTGVAPGALNSWVD